MTTITTLNTNDSGATSRTVINDNFSNLNTDKWEASIVLASTGKTTPVDADLLAIVDSEASNVLKKLTWANLKATLKTYNDTLYPSGSGTSTGTNTGDNATNTQYSGLASSKEDVANKSTNTSLGTSDTLYPSQNAVKTYADNLVAGLLDYRGAYDASVNTFPASGGSGTAGAVMKGDMWIISVAGTLGGVAVQIGDSVIANVDTPAQTASNWNILNANISYVPEDVANKATTMSGNTASDTKYLSAKAVYDWGIATFALLAGSISQAFAVSQLEVGHATDTSITRVSAGKIAVEGVNVLTTSSTDIVTNKRYQPRVYTATNNASLTPEIDTYDVFHLTAMSANTTINNPSSSTEADGEIMEFRFLDNGTARTLTWGTDYVAKAGVSLPTTTVLSKNLTCLFEWNANLSKWNLLASGQEA